MAALHSATFKRGPAEGPYDAVVVGGGAVGGFAALLLTEAGLRVLVLDAGVARSPLRKPLHWAVGRVVRRLADPSGMRFISPKLAYRGRAVLKILARRRQPIQSRCYAWERAPDAFVDDIECPYTTPPDKPFDWFRSRQLGGRLALPGHGRQYYRFSREDLSPADCLSPAWPFPPEELDPWYAQIERRLKLTGALDNIPHLPDSEIADIVVPTPAEAAAAEKLRARWPDIRIAAGRFAPPLNTLALASLSGRLRIRQGAIVRNVEVSESGRVRGVTWIDQATGAEMQTAAPVVFLCASTLETTRILMLSRSERSPNGLGGASKVLGHFLMDHLKIQADGIGPALPPGPIPQEGRCLYLPRFDTREAQTEMLGRSFVPGRGFGIQFYQSPALGRQSYFIAVAFAEMLPRFENKVEIDRSRKDAWGIPILHIDCSYSEAELAMAEQQILALRELAEAIGTSPITVDTAPKAPGGASHECGTARMGADAGNSVLNPHNECWDARGLYVTDGACFPSQGSQNPTLTMLALTARASHHLLR